MPKPTPEQAAKAIELALGGKSQRETAQSLGIDPATIGRWKLSSPVFAQALRNAQEEGSIARVEWVKQMVATEENVHRARVVSDVERWALERQFRKQWGAQVDINLTERVDIGGALIEARKRSLLPMSNLALGTQTQALEYTDYTSVSATDNESGALPDGMPDPFS